MATVLDHLAYERRAHDLVRFVDDPNDDAVAAVVRRVVAGPAGERNAFRDAVSEAAAYTLLAFTHRRAIAALRADDLSFAVEAVDALSLVTRSTIDARDLRVDLPLIAVRMLGGDPTEVARQAAGRSDPDTAAVLTGRADATRTRTLDDVGYIPTRSSYGLGVIRGRARSFRPTTDLVATAVRLADAIDEDGRFGAEPLHTSDLPRRWFDPDGTGSITTAGCVGFSAPTAPDRRGRADLLVFVVEVDDPDTAAHLAAQADRASTPARPRQATWSDRRLALVVAGPDTAADADEFLPRCTALAARALTTA